MSTHLASIDGAIKMKQFNLISCFSITMWIHLHHGDMLFLDRLGHRTERLVDENYENDSGVNIATQCHSVYIHVLKFY